MKRLAWILVVVIGFAAFIGGCAGPGTSSSTPTVVEGEIVAWVNNEPIPQSLVDTMLESIPPQMQAQVNTPDGMKNLVENLVNAELIFQQAKKDGFADSAAVQAKIGQLTKQVVYSEYIKDALAKQGKVDDAKALAFYNENKARFGGGDKTKASHILYKTADDGSDDAAKRAACEKLLSKAQKAGADFAALAKANSEGPSAPKGGDLGFFEQGQMVKPFADAAFALKEGDVSGCVKSRFGYHIIKKTGEQEGQAKEFETVKAQIIQMLERQGQQEVHDKLVADLRANATIKYNDAGAKEEAPKTEAPKTEAPETK
jgi:peptidyl-prolyl cis-trans isomerase C